MKINDNGGLMITWTESDGPTINGETWPTYLVEIRSLPIANFFKDLHITADEADLVIHGMLCDLEDRMCEYMADWVKEVRG